jgi:hypothetical protein
MVDKVRLSVDQETQFLLQSITDGLHDRLRDLLSAQPDWAGEQHREIQEKLQAIVTRKPSWATALQAAMTGELERELGLIRGDVMTAQATLTEQLASVHAKLQRVEDMLIAQKQTDETNCAVLVEVSAVMQRHQTLLEYLSRPWWKRIFGGRPQ